MEEGLALFYAYILLSYLCTKEALKLLVRPTKVSLHSSATVD